MFAPSINAFVLFVQDHRFWGYVLLFVGMVLEGEVFLIVSAMLARIHAFEFGDVLWVSFLGIMVGDVLWYAVGILISRLDENSFLPNTATKTVLMFFPNFRRKPFLSILFSKFIYGVNHAALVFSGMIRLRFSLFMQAELIASFVWVAIYAVAGYMFGYAALAVTHQIERFALLALAFVVGFVMLERWVRIYVENQRLKKHNEDHNA